MAVRQRMRYCNPILCPRLVLLNFLPLLGFFGLFDEGYAGCFFPCALVSAFGVAIDIVLHGQGMGLLGFWVTCLTMYTFQLGLMMRVRISKNPDGSDAGISRARAVNVHRTLRNHGAVRAEVQGAMISGGTALPPAVVPDVPTPPPNAAPVFGGKLSSLHPVIRTISIVLPCADERDNALRTVERFCERTPSDRLAEIIVVDDGSTPPLRELFEQDRRRLLSNVRCKVKILRHEETIGLMAAKLTGGKAASGDVIGFFDCHVAPQHGWEKEIIEKVQENPRRMVVPAITDLDMDTFDEKVNSAVNAKCYLTFDADFKWFDDESDYIPTISGGLAAMGREWFNMTGGFDEEMHGWGGENLDQSLRNWLCGGEIMRAKSSRIAHMWRAGDPRTAAHYSVKARSTNNRGRVVAAWYDKFVPYFRGEPVPKEEVANYVAFKRRLACKPFSFFLYRFRKMYIEGGVIPQEEFRLREKSSGLCLAREGMGTAGRSCSGLTGFGIMQSFQKGNVDRELQPHKCCSGLRLAADNDCLDFFNEWGANFYSCDVSGNNRNQHYRFRDDGRIVKNLDSPPTCLFLEQQEGRPLQKRPCDELAGNVGVWEKVDAKETPLYQTYKSEVAKYRYAEEFPDLPDN